MDDEDTRHCTDVDYQPASLDRVLCRRNAPLGFYLAASALLCLGLICFAFHTATFQQIIPLLAVSFILYVLPHVAIGIVGGLAGLNARLRLFVRS